MTELADFVGLVVEIVVKLALMLVGLKEVQPADSVKLENFASLTVGRPPNLEKSSAEPVVADLIQQRYLPCFQFTGS